MPDIWFDVDAALAEVPVNLMPLVDDTDFKSRETSVAYNATGMDLVWNFVTCAGAFTQTAVTPTTGGDYDWTHQGDAIYTIEMPASGGASINNDTEGFGWFSGIATGVLPWRGPVIGFRAAGLNNLLIENAYSTTRGLSGTALPDAAAEASGGLFTRGTGAGQINQAANGNIDANSVRIGGTAQTGRDIGASVLLSSGTGTGQLDFTSGVVKANAVQISDDSAAADNCELMFDGTGYAGGTTKLGVDVVAVSGDSAAADALESYCDGTTPIPANATQISGDSTAADNLEAACDGNTYNVGGGAVVAASVTGAVGSVTGAVGSVTGNVGGNVAGSVASVTGAVGSVTAGVTVTTNNDKTGYTASTVSDKTGYSLSTAGVQAIWDALTSALTTVGSIGKKLADWVLHSDNKVLLAGTTHTSAVIPEVTAVTGAVGSVTGAVGSVTGNVGGNVVGSVASVTGAVGSVTAAVTIAASQITIKKNVAFSNFTFPMYNASGTFQTGLTVTVELSKDAGAFAGSSNSASEIGSSGWYKIDLTQTELNASTIGFKATASGALPTGYTIVTQP